MCKPWRSASKDCLPNTMVMPNDGHNVSFEWGTIVMSLRMSNGFDAGRCRVGAFLGSQDKPPRRVVDTRVVLRHGSLRHDNHRRRPEPHHSHQLGLRARSPYLRQMASFVSSIIGILAFCRCSVAREQSTREPPLVQKAKRFDGDGPVGFLDMRSLRRLA